MVYLFKDGAERRARIMRGRATMIGVFFSGIDTGRLQPSERAIFKDREQFSALYALILRNCYTELCIQMCCNRIKFTITYLWRS